MKKVESIQVKLNVAFSYYVSLGTA